MYGLDERLRSRRNGFFATWPVQYFWNAPFILLLNSECSELTHWFYLWCSRFLSATGLFYQETIAPVVKIREVFWKLMFSCWYNVVMISRLALLVFVKTGKKPGTIAGKAGRTVSSCYRFQFSIIVAIWFNKIVELWKIICAKIIHKVLHKLNLTVKKKISRV